MLDPLWLRSVFEQEGLDGWTLRIGPQAHGGRCHCGTHEVCIGTLDSHSRALEEMAHALVGAHALHGPEFIDAMVRLIDEHTVPVCRGSLGLEG